MQESSWTIAVEEFLHVGGALIAIIAVVSILTGLIREYIPQEKLQKKMAKHENRGPLMGALLGTLTPFCSASMVPVVMSMVEMGASMGTIFGFLVSAPLCNFVVVGLILAAFGLDVALIYLGADAWRRHLGRLCHQQDSPANPNPPWRVGPRLQLQRRPEAVLQRGSSAVLQRRAGTPV